MDLRSGRRLVSSPTPGPRRRRRLPALSEPDRISALPDEMLLQILARLLCARAAAHTSGLSRRWRGLWRHLPELFFRETSSDALDAALRQVACPALSLLEVDIPKTEKHRAMDPALVSVLLRAAARLAPANLLFRYQGQCKYLGIPIEIPCFQRATSVKLDIPIGTFLTPPAGAVQFPLLERLSVVGCRVDTAELVLRCPRLRVLEVSSSPIFTVKVHSPTIEELVVEGNVLLTNVDIIAPVLKRIRLAAIITRDYAVSFSAPMVENLSWTFLCPIPIVGFGDKWRLRTLSLEMKDNIGVVSKPPVERSISQDIAQLPAFSVLNLVLETQKHAFGALVSHLLGICSTIKSLSVVIAKVPGKKTCKPNCACDHPQNWRNADISLTCLEEVQVVRFGGTDQEVDILKLLFRCGTMMKRMTVLWDPKFSPTSRDCKNIYSIFGANPGVKCFISPSRAS